ncbi:hypothetical protein OOJ91_02620 [Micromonospora lupini]|uniref:hypothetical protein n=1 Tax=Micromonospora lupini TaxID=285679 RepID=UPI00224F6040|nr:hypothetical protein [Micromonospora lupini]MCX5064765.1 hypothetical protein [Micromonospora lupini]
MDEQPVFGDRWWDLRRGGAAERQLQQALLAELLTELAAGHPLHGQPITVIAKSEVSDDIVVGLPAGRFALIHLTWKGASETPPWPKTEFYDRR